MEPVDVLHGKAPSLIRTHRERAALRQRNLEHIHQPWTTSYRILSSLSETRIQHHSSHPWPITKPIYTSLPAPSLLVWTCRMHVRGIVHREQETSWISSSLQSRQQTGHEGDRHGHWVVWRRRQRSLMLQISFIPRDRARNRVMPPGESVLDGNKITRWYRGRTPLNTR